jgi:hypothetical protein
MRLDAALHGARQCGDDATPRLVVGENIGENADVLLRAVDILDEAIDDRIIIVDQIDGIAAERRQSAKSCREVCNFLPGLFQTSRRARGEAARRFGGEGCQIVETLASPFREARPADQQKKDDAGDREKEDQQQPATHRCR